MARSLQCPLKSIGGVFLNDRHGGAKRSFSVGFPDDRLLAKLQVSPFGEIWLLISSISCGPLYQSLRTSTCLPRWLRT